MQPAPTCRRRSTSTPLTATPTNSCSSPGRRLDNKSYLPADAGGAERGGAAEIPRHPRSARSAPRPARPTTSRHRRRRHLGGDESQDGEARLDALSSTTCRARATTRAWPSAIARRSRGARAHAQDGHRRTVRRQHFCHDVRVIRIARHGASVPIGMGVSCSADRQALGKITGTASTSAARSPTRHIFPDVRPPTAFRRRRRRSPPTGHGAPCRC